MHKNYTKITKENPVISEFYSNMILKSWVKFLIQNGRFPKGTEKSGLKNMAAVKLLAQSEKSNIQKLRDIFNRDRGDITKNLLNNKKDLISYLLGFHLANAARLENTLTRLFQRQKSLKEAINTYNHVQIWDLGCGSGAMSQVWLRFLHEVLRKPLDLASFFLVDLNRVLIDSSIDLLKNMKEDLVVYPIKSNLENLRWVDLPENTIRILNFGYVWNELGKNGKAVKNICFHLDQIINQNLPALLVFVEPATQTQSRNLMSFRNVLVEKGFNTLYPCPHDFSCPMLERSKDWCFSEFAWDKPTEQKLIDQVTQAERQSISSSSFVFGSPRFMESLLKKNENHSEKVVVGRPVLKEDDRKFEYLLCTSKGSLEKTLGQGSKFQKRGELSTETSNRERGPRGGSNLSRENGARSGSNPKRERGPRSGSNPKRERGPRSGSNLPREKGARESSNLSRERGVRGGSNLKRERGARGGEGTVAPRKQ